MSKQMSPQEIAFNLTEEGMAVTYNSIENLMADIANGKMTEASTLEALKEIALFIIKSRQAICECNRTVLGDQATDVKLDFLRSQGFALLKGHDEVMARYQQAAASETRTTLAGMFK